MRLIVLASALPHIVAFATMLDERMTYSVRHWLEQSSNELSRSLVERVVDVVVLRDERRAILRLERGARGPTGVGRGVRGGRPGLEYS